MIGDEIWYTKLLKDIRTVSLPEKLFTTKPSTSNTLYNPALYDLFLSRLPKETRKHYDCRECRKFVDTYGWLVEILPDGRKRSVFWSKGGGADGAGGDHVTGALARRVEGSPVTGRFLTDREPWGVVCSPRVLTGNWYHMFHAGRQEELRPGETLAGLLAKHAENKELLQKACFLYHPVEVRFVEEQLRFFRASDKHLAVIRWFAEAQGVLQGAASLVNSLAWKISSDAPEGFCHIENTVVGLMLKHYREIGSVGMEAAYRNATHALTYQRPQSPPKEGTINQAEKLVEEFRDRGIDIARALERKYATLDDVKIHASWLPSSVHLKANGVFSDLRKRAPVTVTNLGNMTWARFIAEEYLKGCTSIDFYAPHSPQNYFAFCMPTHPDAPMLLQWDHGVNWYMYHGGSDVSCWGLKSSEWVPVKGVFRQPDSWTGKPVLGEGAFFVLRNARDYNSYRAGLALFPEEMRQEFRPVRSVIEAKSKSGRLSEPSSPYAQLACGVCFQEKTFDNRSQQQSYTFRLTNFTGNQIVVNIDRWR